MRFGITPPVTDRLGVNPIGRQIALSPNGRVLVYAADDGQLFARTLGQLEVVPIPGTRDARYPFMSPDGQWVGYFSPNAIRKVALSGGLPITVCRVVGLPFGATWTADGTVVFGSDRGLMSVPAAGGEPRPLATQAENGQTEGLRHVFPQALPGGRAVLFTIDPAGRTADTGQIAALDVATGHYTVLVQGASAPQYVDPGFLIFAAHGSLRAVRFDPVRLEIQGTAVTLIESVQMRGGAAEYAVSQTGTLAYLPRTAAAEPSAARSLVWVDRSGREIEIPAPRVDDGVVRLSPDETRLAVDVRDADSNSIWISGISVVKHWGA